MPYRFQPIVPEEIYHVYNRSVGGQLIFTEQRSCERVFNLINFYCHVKPRLRFSHFNRLTLNEKTIFLSELETKSPKQIILLAFCLMPNHIHFLLKGLIDNGINSFMRNFQNSYAKFFNTKYKRQGALFQSMFRAVRIETDEQLLHVCRYIHLNPFSSFLVKSIRELENYPWSSFPDYLKKRNSNLVTTDFILNFYPSINEFKKFTFDQADYQRKLKQMEYFLIEELGKSNPTNRFPDVSI